MAQLHLHLLGDFRLTFNDKPITKLDTPRLRALVAYLALHRHAPQARHHLAFRFWPDSSEAQALTNLRKQLLYLRNALPAVDILRQVARQTVQWLPTAEFAFDVAEFEATLSRATSVDGEPAIHLLRQAIDLYRGDLLPECYDEWIFPRREALREQYAGSLERLVLLLEAQRDYPAALGYAQRLLRHDPLHEPTYRCLMRLHALNGDRATALRIYHTCVTQLREELGVDPDAETQHSYERLLHGEALSTQPAALAANAPFVGRQPEWQQLQQSWRMALAGQPQFVLIAGEAGIGKTRLAEELLSWATHQGFYTVRSRCYAAEGRLTYAPVIEWLRTEGLRTHRAKIAATWLTELARLLPELLNEAPTLPRPEPMTQNWQRHHLFEAVTRALLAIDQPLLLLIDDLQWCDKETLELLHFLLRNAATLSQTKLLVVGTARLPDEVDATHPLSELLNPLRGSNTLTQVDLGRLTAAETSQLARQMAGRTLDNQALQQIFSDTAGNPLFVVETMRATQSETAPNGAAGKPTLAAALPIEASEAIIQHLPPKVLAVIQARLGQLSPTARELCEWAAIVGRAFTLDLLANASQITQDKAVNALDELWQRRIIREQGNDAYDFSHDRIRDVAAAGISRVRRRYLHRCMAETLEGQGASQLDIFAAQIAAHYDAAGIVEKAIDYYEQAAESARRVYATQETVTLLQRALQLIETLPESSKRHQRELTLLVALGPSLADVRNFEVTLMRDVYERAYLLSQRLGIPLHPSLLRVLAIHKVARRNFVQAQEMGQQLLDIAGQQSAGADEVVYLEDCYVIGVAAFWQGHFTQARVYLQQVVDSYAHVRQEHHVIEYGHDTGAYCRTRLGWTLWYLGYPDQARQHCEVALDFARKLQHPFTVYMVLVYCALCACNCRDANTLEPFIHLLNNIEGSPYTQKGNQFSFLDGWLLLLRGKIDDSIQYLFEYTVVQREIRFDSTSYPYAVALLAEAYIQAGDYAHALAVLSEVFAAFDGSPEYWYIAEMYRLKGEALLGQGEQITEAEACFQQALEIARRQQAKSLELRAAMSLAKLWAQQGKRGEAYALLAEVYDWFTEGFDTADLLEARALLSELDISLGQ